MILAILHTEDMLHRLLTLHQGPMNGAILVVLLSLPMVLQYHHITTTTTIITIMMGRPPCTGITITHPLPLLPLCWAALPHHHLPMSWEVTRTLRVWKWMETAPQAHQLSMN
jgi:hypothetical protein